MTAQSVIDNIHHFDREAYLIIPIVDKTDHKPSKTVSSCAMHSYTLVCNVGNITLQ